MADIKSIHLTSLLIGISRTNCKDPNHNHENSDDYDCPERKEYIRITNTKILDTLETKDASAFHYKEPDYRGADPTFEDFMTASCYTFDENTLNWVARANKADPLRKKLIEILADAGIVKYSNGNDINKGSQLIYDLMSCESDENLCWLLGWIGLKPSEFSYRNYGQRKDRTFSQKKRMFEMLFHTYRLQPEHNSITDCFGFSKDMDEVIYFIKWFHSRGVNGTTCDLPNSFLYFGTKLFGLLEELRVRIESKFSLEQIVRATSQPTSEKIKALCWFKTRRHQFSHELFDIAWRTGNIELCREVVANGVPITGDNIWRLLFHSERTTSIADAKLDFDFVVQCLGLALARLPYYEIPYEVEDKNHPWYSLWYQFQRRDSYCFEGRLYDWMLANHPPMKASIQKQNEIKAKKEEADAAFKAKYGITKLELWKLQDKAKSNGVCMYYTHKKINEDCHHWPKCSYFHGPIEQAYNKTYHDPCDDYDGRCPYRNDYYYDNYNDDDDDDINDDDDSVRN